MLWWLLWSCGAVPERTVQPAEVLAAGEAEVLWHWTAQLADPALRGRDEGSVGSAIARRGVVAQLEACGVEPAGQAGFEQRIRTGQGTNVLGRVAGVGGEHQAVLISAHLDHQDLGGWWAHPGVQDNAAAVAIVLHTACALAAEPPARDVIVAFWDAEEPPTFLTDAMGSRYFVANPTLPLEGVGAAVVLDLLGAGLWEGYAGTFALGAETSEQVREVLRRTPVPPPLVRHQASLSVVEDMVVGRDMVWSDYEAFRRAGVPVLFLTDGANERYHTSRDRVEALEPARLASEARHVHGLVRALADHGDPYVFAPVRDPRGDADAVRRLLDDALGYPGWSSLARSSLQAHRARLVGEELDPKTVRAAAQALMCWAGPLGVAVHVRAVLTRRGGARSGDRTRTPRREGDFKSPVSTDSTIRARASSNRRRVGARQRASAPGPGLRSTPPG